jgi:Lrp/AsnC family transcriptional regulator for asnA, asnC and gidA
VFLTTGSLIFCKIRAKDTKHAKDDLMIDDIEGVYRTETMISLESINDKSV